MFSKQTMTQNVNRTLKSKGSIPIELTKEELDEIELDEIAQSKSPEYVNKYKVI